MLPTEGKITAKITCEHQDSTYSFPEKMVQYDSIGLPAETPGPYRQTRNLNFGSGSHVSKTQLSAKDLGDGKGGTLRPSRLWTTKDPKGCLENTHNFFATASATTRNAYDFEWFIPITQQMSTISVETDYVGSDAVLTQGGPFREYIYRVASLFPSIDR